MQQRKRAPVEEVDLAGPNFPPEMWYYLFNFFDDDLLAKSMRVSYFWKNSADDIAKRQLKSLFPEVYKKITDPSYCQDFDQPKWVREWHFTYLKYCHNLQPSRLKDYRGIRSCNQAAIRKILAKPNSEERLLMVDGQRKTLFDYLAKLEDLSAKQAILNDIFISFSQVLKKGDGKLDDKRIYDDELADRWGEVLHEFDDTDQISALLLLAALCNQHHLVSSLIEDLGEEEFRRFYGVRLMWLAFDFTHIETLIVILKAFPSSIFMLDDIELLMPVNQIFANGLFNYIRQIDLGADPAQRTLLHWAIILNQQQYLQQTDCPADELNRQIYNYQPIDFACAWGRGLFDLLIAKGAQLTTSVLTLEICAGFDHPVLVRQLQKLRPRDRAQALQVAVLYGCLDSVEILLQDGVELMDDVIWLAILFRQIHILDYFIRNVNFKLKVDAMIKEIIQLGFKDSVTYPDLFDAACNLSVLRYLVKCGFDINLTDDDGDTVLHRLVIHARRDTVAHIRELVKMGADTNAKNIHNQTPLHYAAMGMRENLILVDLNPFLAIQELGGDIVGEDRYGMSPYDYLVLKCPNFKPLPGAGMSFYI